MAAPPALPAAAQRSCQELISALPTTLGERAARPVDSPSPYVVAWGEPPVVLRCGVARPATFIATADTLVISGVTWFAERRGTTHRRGPRSTGRCTSRWSPPADDASDPAARLATAVSRALPPRPLDPAD